MALSMYLKSQNVLNGLMFVLKYFDIRLYLTESVFDLKGVLLTLKAYFLFLF